MCSSRTLQQHLSVGFCNKTSHAAAMYCLAILHGPPHACYCVCIMISRHRCYCRASLCVLSLLQVAYNYNRRIPVMPDSVLPLRYTVVVTADNAAALPAQRQHDVSALLDNSDTLHKTVIGATLQQTKHLLTAIGRQLS